ncbi:hypothetical protein C10C_0188 [Chlamydia serpentis]|uniref:Uncharacterized protein n=1 Tax=Chlamydia serpentis TaxID=1967782 RepID=A0A2R8FAC0_9CHLA|nr:hypothetical protein [Chlamydia serpentis]SPN73368.1 hypothetical protein C10C_0188 [Chlamydia serpentis]
MNPLTFDRREIWLIPEQESSLKKNSYIVTGGLFIVGIALSILGVLCLGIGLPGLSVGVALTLGIGCLILALILLTFSLILFLSEEKKAVSLISLNFERDLPFDRKPLTEKVETESELYSSLAERLAVVEEDLKIAKKFNERGSAYV